MKLHWTALLAEVLFTGCDTREQSESVQPLETNAPASPHKDSDLKKEIDFAYGVMPANNPLSAENLPIYSKNKIVYEHHSFADYLFSMLNPEALEKYEGSYTAGEIRERHEAEIPKYSLSSSWLLHNKKLPKTDITVARNPATGRYEVSGGEVFFQEQGLA